MRRLKRSRGTGGRAAWHEVILLTRNTRTHKWLLLAPRRRDDIVAHLARQHLQHEPRLHQPLRQRASERAIAAGAVARGAARRGGEHDQHVVDLDPAQPARHRARACLPGLPERIVAAGIEHDDPLLRARQCAQHLVEVDRLEAEVVIAGEAGIDRQQPVPAVRLDPVPGEIDEGDLGPLRLLPEAAERRAHLGDGGIVHRHDFEAGLAQRIAHQPRIAQRIGELAGGGIGAVADHQRDAGAGMGSGGKRQRQHHEQPFAQKHHRLPPSR